MATTNWQSPVIIKRKSAGRRENKERRKQGGMKKGKPERKSGRGKESKKKGEWNGNKSVNDN